MTREVTTKFAWMLAMPSQCLSMSRRPWSLLLVQLRKPQIRNALSLSVPSRQSCRLFLSSSFITIVPQGVPLYLTQTPSSVVWQAAVIITRFTLSPSQNLPFLAKELTGNWKSAPGGPSGSHRSCSRSLVRLSPEGVKRPDWNTLMVS